MEITAALGRVMNMVKLLATLLFGLLAGLLLTEGALRVYNPIPLTLRGQRFFLPKNKVEVRRHPYGDPRYEAQIHASTNSLGFRGPERLEDRAGVTEIVAVGGSTTECHFVSNDKIWTKLLADGLAAQGLSVWLNNAGLDGNSTFGHRLLLEQHILPLRPDVVLFLIGVNDVGRGDLNVSDAGTRRALRDMVIERSELLSTMQALFRSVRAKEQGLSYFANFDITKSERLEMSDEEITTVLAEHGGPFLEGYERRVRELLALTRGAGIEPILITQPSLYGDYVDPTTGVEVGAAKILDEWSRHRHTNAKAHDLVLERYNDVVRRVGPELGVAVVDLAAKLPKDSALYVDWVHYSVAGNAKVAEILAAELGPILAARTVAKAR